MDHAPGATSLSRSTEPPTLEGSFSIPRRPETLNPPPNRRLQGMTGFGLPHKPPPGGFRFVAEGGVEGLRGFAVEDPRTHKRVLKANLQSKPFGLGV